MIETREELGRAREECRRMVTRYAAASGAAGAIPLPGIDLAVDVFSLARLLTRINERFGVTEDEVGRMDAGLRGILLGAMAGTGSEFIGKRLGPVLVRRIVERIGARVVKRSVAKLIPFAGMAAAAGVSFAATRTLGLAHVEACYQAVTRVLEAKRV